MANATTIMSAARMVACREYPYFAEGILRLTFLELPGCGTMMTSDRMVTYYDPEWVVTLPVREVAGVIIHELGHILGRHSVRCKRGHFDHVEFNMAGDREINDDIVGGPLHLPKDRLMPADIGMRNGLTAEEYLEGARKKREEEEKREEEKRQKQQERDEKRKQQRGETQQPAPPKPEEKDEETDAGSGGKGSAPEPGKDEQKESGESGSGSDDPSEDEGEGGSGSGGGQGDEDDGEGEGGGGQSAPKTSEKLLPAKPARGSCGSCATGVRAEHEPEASDDDGGRGLGEIESIRRMVAESITQHAERNPGKIPGGWKVWAQGELEPPQIRWQAKLARVVRNAVEFRAGMTDRTYRRQSRRQASVGHGLGAPRLAAWRSPKPRVCVVVDTSGSMGGEPLKLALSEAQGILKALRCDVDFICADTKTQSRKKVKNVTEMMANVAGGGGTDFRPVFDDIEKTKQDKPDIVIFATDGYGPAPVAKPRGIEVIWLLTGTYTTRPAEWGTYVEVS